MDATEVIATGLTALTSPIWIGPALVYAVGAAIIETIKGILNRAKIKERLGKKNIKNMCRIAHKTANRVKISGLENNKIYEITADEVADDVRIGDKICC